MTITRIFLYFIAYTAEKQKIMVNQDDSHYIYHFPMIKNVKIKIFFKFLIFKILKNE